MTERIETVDDYIASYSEDVASRLDAVRRLIHESVPDLEETISYQMPTFKQDGKTLVYIGGWKHHIGLYPVPQLSGTLENEVSKLRAAKDTLRFPHDEPLPDELIQKVVVALSER